MRDREEVAKIIVQSFYAVYGVLGYGFLERVYGNALAIELRDRGLVAEQQRAVPVYFKHQQVGDYFADMLVENCVVIELKAVEYLKLEHEAQLINYLKASEISLGLLLNFGPKPQIKRKIYEDARSHPINQIAQTCDEVSERS